MSRDTCAVDGSRRREAYPLRGSLVPVGSPVAVALSLPLQCSHSHGRDAFNIDEGVEKDKHDGNPVRASLQSHTRDQDTETPLCELLTL